MDITGLIQKSANKNIIEEVFLNDSKALIELFPMVEHYANLHQSDFRKHLETLLDDYYYYFHHTLDDKKKELCKELNYSHLTSVRFEGGDSGYLTGTKHPVNKGL